MRPPLLSTRTTSFHSFVPIELETPRHLDPPPLRKCTSIAQGPPPSVWKVVPRQKRFLIVLNHWAYTAFFLLLTIYALFGDDIRLASTSLPSDPIFFSLSCICMFFFGLELFMASISKDGYWFGFYFWLDLLATVSMISDIGWIWDEIVDTNSGGSSGITKSTQLARAARASRAGTRAGRIIRMVRIVRLIRIVKLYKIAQEAGLSRPEEIGGDLFRTSVIFRGDSEPISFAHVDSSIDPFQKEYEISLSESEDICPSADCRMDTEGITDMNTGTALGINSRRTSTNVEYTRTSGVKPPPPMIIEEAIETDIGPEMQEVNNTEESRVGQRLSEITTKRVILLVLGMMFCLPLFSSQMYINENTSYMYGLTVLDQVSEGDDFSMVWDDFLDQHKSLFTPLIYLEVLGLRKWQASDPAYLRTIEKDIAVLDTNVGSRHYVSVTQSWAIIDLRPSSRIQAGLNILRTVFVCLVLSVSSLLFTKDANSLVIEPIERMTARVKRIAQNPLKAAMEDEINNLALEEELKKQSTQLRNGHRQLETEMLENTIIKVGALLALGFGEAGTEIITANIKRGSGDINPMIPGKKTHCVFGFCDIRRFAEVTEVLQEEIMLFVNEIAEIVHNTVYRFSGSANKNIGDAFLLVWKLPKFLETFIRQRSLDPTPHLLHQYADMSLVSFLKILAAINSDVRILRYSHRTDLLTRLPNYSVKMGFGLHVGWAIEGAIGSEFKVDASYLSPNVNLASRLEAASRQFGVPLLVSGQLYDLLSPQVQIMMRQLDCVLVKGSKVPMRLFTWDVTLVNIPPPTEEESFSLQSSKTAKVLLRQQRDRILRSASSRQKEIWRYFETDRQLVAMRSRVSLQFLSAFREAFNDYLRGDWKGAVKGLTAAIQLKGEIDGPSSVLIAFIESRNYEVPVDWAGFRELTEK